jgi:hypothetical protein
MDTSKTLPGSKGAMLSVIRDAQSYKQDAVPFRCEHVRRPEMKAKRSMFLCCVILAAPIFANQNNLFWLVDNDDGFGSGGGFSCCMVDPEANMGVVDIAEYNDEIYAGTWRIRGAKGYRRALGEDQWVDTEAGLEGQGFTATSLCVFDGEGGDAPAGLYMGTWDNEGFDIQYYDGSRWNVITWSGFDLPAMQAATSIVEYEGRLYVGVFRNAESGGTKLGHVWQDEFGEWHFDQVNQDGFGDPTNTDSTSMVVVSHEGEQYLCVGTENREPDGNGTEIWCAQETDGAFSWVQINEDGFDYAPGSDKNTNSSLFAASDGSLYVGTCNSETGSEVWRYTGDFITERDAAHWERIMDNGFVNEYPLGRTRNYCIGLHAIEEYRGKLYFGTGKAKDATYSHSTGAGLTRGPAEYPTEESAEGAEIWSYERGVWSLEMRDGLVDKGNYHIHVIREIEGDLWVGTQHTMRSYVLRSVECRLDQDCDDSLWCNGLERCVNNHCMPGQLPCPADALFCNGEESCDEETHQCLHSGNPCSDGNACTDDMCNEADNTCEFTCNAQGSGDPCCNDAACLTEPICQQS